MSTVEQDEMAKREGFAGLPAVYSEDGTLLQGAITPFEHYCYTLYGGQRPCGQCGLLVGHVAALPCLPGCVRPDEPASHGARHPGGCITDQKYLSPDRDEGIDFTVDL